MTSRDGSRRGAASRLGGRLFPAAFALWAAVPGTQLDSKLYAKVLAKDDEAFARELSRQGYADLAEDVLKALEAAGGSGGAGSGVKAELLRLDIAQDDALRELDPLVRVDKLEALIRQREEFARAHAGSPEAGEIMGGQLEQYRLVGELITQVLQEGKAPDPQALTERGIEILKTAVDQLTARKETLDEEAMGDVTPERQPDLDTERMINSYGLARTQYFRALLYPPDSVERKLILDQALKILLDFQLDYADQMLCFEGYIYEGLCHKALNDPEGALSSFEESVRLREYYPEERGVYKVEPAAADTISSAVLQKMLLLSEQGDHAGAVAVAEDYIATIADPFEALKGKAVLAQEAEAYQALGDNERLTATAKRLMEIDPNGPAGRRGRELLGEGSSGSLGASEILRLAESSYTSDPDKAIELFQQAMALTRGTADRENVGARAGYLIGALYQQRKQLHEAAVAWETTAERFPNGKDAPECLWQAISTYLNLQSYERRPVYKELAQARLADLTKRYPTHPRAASASLIDGQQAEAEGDYKRAAEVYEKVPESSAAYEEALYRAGSAWATMARQAFAEKQADVGKQAVARAEKLYLKAREALEKAATETLEISAQERFKSLAFNARVALANLYLEPEVGRAADVMALFQKAESELGDDAGRMGTVWELRFHALSEQKKVDEAMQLFDTRMKENPNAPWLANGARLLAPILDARGSELRKADPKSAEADRLWRKAAANYLLAIKGQLEGREAVQLESLEGVADRLFIFALHFEGLPDTVDTFVDYAGPPLSGELLEDTVKAYELILPLTPSYRTAIKLARTLGFLGRWEETAAHYAELFERESFVNLTTKSIDQEARSSKPELLFALIEWGVCERTIGVERGDVQRLVRASSIFESLVMGNPVESKLWWQAKFFQMQTLVDRGDYEVADVAMKSLRLNWDKYDENKYGLQERFKKLEEEISKKVFKK